MQSAVNLENDRMRLHELEVGLHFTRDLISSSASSHSLLVQNSPPLNSPLPASTLSTSQQDFAGL